VAQVVFIGRSLGQKTHARRLLGPWRGTLRSTNFPRRLRTRFLVLDLRERQNCEAALSDPRIARIRRGLPTLGRPIWAAWALFIPANARSAQQYADQRPHMTPHGGDDGSIPRYFFSSSVMCLPRYAARRARVDESRRYLRRTRTMNTGWEKAVTTSAWRWRTAGRYGMQVRHCPVPELLWGGRHLGTGGT